MERGRARLTLLHQFDNDNDPLSLLSSRVKHLLDQLSVLSEFITANTTEDIQIILWQLERRHFKPNRARRIG